MITTSCKDLAKEYEESLKSVIEDLPIAPTLAVVSIGDDPASKIYIRNKKRMCERVGIHFFHYVLSGDTEEKEVIELIERLNKDNNVDGIMVQLPLPKHLNTYKIINTISENKDVDGLTTANLGKLYASKTGTIGSHNCSLIPCTPSGILHILKRNGVQIEGKNVCVIGRSTVVGQTIAKLLTDADATVTLCHSKTADLKEHTKNADIIIAAAGHAKLVTADMVKEGCVVIDVGINREGGKLCGDVDYEGVSKIADFVTPVPGGVGPMTVIMLGWNTLRCYNKEKYNEL